jgi:hypothetical protein
MMKRTTEVVVAIAAIVYLVQQQNRQHGFCQEGSGSIPANFQAKKSHNVVPGTVFVEGRGNIIHGRLILGLLMATKASRQFASLPIH